MALKQLKLNLVSVKCIDNSIPKFDTMIYGFAGSMC